MPQPQSVEDLARELLAMFERSWDRITREEQAILNSWSGWRRVERLQRLRELRVMVEQLMDHADEQALRFIEDSLPQAYLLGVVGADVGISGFAQPDLDAIGVLARDGFRDLLAATGFVRTSTKTLIRTLAREHIADKLVRGVPAEQAARELARAVQSRGIAAVVYRDGSRHGLADYANVVVRTKTAEAYSTGSLNAMDRAGVQFAECFDNPSCGLDGHNDPIKPNGRVFELRIAQSAVISHPRCVRAWGARPDVGSAREARSAKGTATPEQNADQAAVEISRQEAAIARALRRRGGSFTDGSARVSSAAHATVLSRRRARIARRGRSV